MKTEDLDEIDWLIQWRNQRCDGFFEHESGIEITTLDNPGWGVTIDLRNTNLENRSMPDFVADHGDEDWMHCTVESRKFRGHGDNFKLRKIIAVFRNWAEHQISHSEETSSNS